MNPATMLGSRIAQMGVADDIERIERAEGSRAARRRAMEALFARTHKRRELVKI